MKTILLHDPVSNSPVLVRSRTVARAIPRRRRLPMIAMALPMFFGWAGIGELAYRWATGPQAGTAPLIQIKRATVSSAG